MRLRTIFLACGVTVPVAAQQPPPPAAASMERAVWAWDAGAYDSALVELSRVLAAPDANLFHDRVAELTGEIWETREVAKDARAPRWSPDGRYLAYEAGTRGDRSVHVVRTDTWAPVVMAAGGVGITISPDGRAAAWMDSSQGGRPAIRVVPLDGGAPQDIPLDVPAATALTLFGRAPVRMALVVGTETDARLIVRELTGDGTWHTVDIPEGKPIDLVRSPDGSRVLVTLGDVSPFARSVPGFAATSRAHALAEIRGRAATVVVRGTEPTWSRDGSSYAWVDTADGMTRLLVRRGDEGATVAATVAERRIQSPALSSDGRTIAFAQLLREDWEIFTAPADGSTPPQRLTREIQHDLFPRFIDEHRLLAVIGEARHRRSHLYDVRTGTRTRLFHNNTVRTVAPEYEWSVSPDGSRVAIVAERDGDTVTPHRHLYVTDLQTKVSAADLRARVDSALRAERALRAEGRRMFAPIAPQVRAAVNEVNVGRIYDYQKQLFAFDSKHITQPGNWKATEWLKRTYEAFGLTTHLQRFTTLQGEALEVANVIATIPGTVDPDLVYVVGAHFDSRAEGPGADDNSSGTAMILEAARVLATRPLPATVMFVAFTGEESGLRGAREFGRRMKDSIRVVGALNNDMMGWSNDHRLDNTIRYSNAGLRDVQHAAAIQFSDLITYDAFYYKSTDAQALYDAWGDIVAGIGSYPILGNPHYHQPHDVLETINHRQLAETSKATIATIMLMASSPSRLTGLAASGKTVTWNRAAEKRITGYVVRYGPPEQPMRFTARTSNPRITLNALQPGWRVAVKGVNAAGLEGWDWARVTVP